MKRYGIGNKANKHKDEVISGKIKSMYFGAFTDFGKDILRDKPKYFTIRIGYKVEALNYSIVDGITVPNLKRKINRKYIKIDLGEVSHQENVKPRTAQRNFHHIVTKFLKFHSFPVKLVKYLDLNMEYGFRYSDRGRRLNLYVDNKWVLSISSQEFKEHCEEKNNED